MAKKKKPFKTLVDKALKARIREDRLKEGAYQKTIEKTHKSKKTYSRKDNKKPLQGDDEAT